MERLLSIGIAAIAGVLLGTSTVLANDAIYRNDFSTRESAHPIPAYGVVHEAQPYPPVLSEIAFTPDALNGYGSSDLNTYLLTQRYTYYAKSVGTDNDRPNYDGWVTPFHVTMSSSQHKAHPSIRNDDGNPMFAWFNNNATASRNGFVFQPIHNMFTSGVLRVQVDMRPPESWYSVPSAYYSCRVFPVFNKYMDPLAMDGQGGVCLVTGKACPNITPGSVGITSGYTGNSKHTVNTTFFRGYYYDSSTGKLANQNLGSSFSSTTNPKWVRFVITYDLDQSKHSAAAYRFDDASHPTFDTEPSATAYGSYADKPSPLLNGADGGITGIGIMGNGVFGVSGSTATKVMVDNLRLSWKAPGAEDFEVFYENDFSNRWHKTVCAASRDTLASGYVPTIIYTNIVDSSSVTFSAPKPLNNFISTNSLVPTVSSPSANAQPLGYDGWRRLPIADSASAYFSAFLASGSQYDRIGDSAETYVYGSGANYATFGSLTSQCRYALVAHPIGETYTDGKVRLSVDMRLPLLTEPTTFVADIMRGAVGFGSTALYSSPRASLAANIVAGCGYVRTRDGSVTNHVPYVMAHSSSSAHEYAQESTYTEPKDNYWHRMEVSVDLDAHTYGVTITPLSSISSASDFTPTNASIYVKTGLPLASDATDIGTIYLRGFGNYTGMSMQYLKGRVCFDNISVWRQAAGDTTETLAYYNDFSTRTRTPTGTPTAYARAIGYVADVFDQDGGPDHWIRRNVTGDEGYWATATVRDDGGNQFLALGREMESGARVQVSHAFGEPVKQPFKFSVDVRPPSGWRTKGGFVLVSLGDAQMEQTEVSESIFNAHRQAAFGFCDTDGDPECPWVRPYMLPIVRTVENGEETDLPLCAASAISDGHWYRFKVRVMPQDGVYGVKLYDMGTEHPAISGASGSLVASAENVTFLNRLAPDDGVSAFSILAYGMGGALGTAGVDADNVMIDNIVVTKIGGIVISVR